MQMARVDTSNNNHRSLASVNDIRAIFHECRAELEWLAYFITGNRAIAAVCVTEACVLSESHTSVFTESLLTWARHATIRSAIETQRNHIRQVSSGYDHTTFVRREYVPLTGETLELVVLRSDVFVARLDVVSRTALVICGVQKNSLADVALMLGVNRAVASAAYSAALDCLEVIRCEHMAHESGSAAMWN